MAAGIDSEAGGTAKARVFISYSRKDMAFTDRLEAALRARGFEPLVDRSEIYAFEDWWHRLQALIGGSDTVVFVLSLDAVASTVALREVAHAAALNKRLAPIVHRRVVDDSVPEPLRRLNFIFFDDDSFEASADKLVEALRSDIGWIRRHIEFGEAARRWMEADRASGLLLRPPLLDQAETWLALRPAGAPTNCNGCGSNWDVAQTAAVGSFPPNQFGLFDTIGNVFQWTEDCVHGNYNGAPTDGSAWITGGICTNRVVATRAVRSATRIEFATVYRSRNAGFRIARTLGPSQPANEARSQPAQPISSTQTSPRCGSPRRCAAP